MLAQADIVINLLPLTPETRGLLDAPLLRRAAAPARRVVNLGRGAHVVDADLLAALDSGHLRHAVLDVFHTEPLPAEPPVLDPPARHGAAARRGGHRPAQRRRGGGGQPARGARRQAVAHLVDRQRGY